MAFQVPAANIAAVTSDLWPSMKSTLAVPWRSQRTSDKRIVSLGQRRPAATASTRPERKTQLHHHPSVELPDCLASTPSEALRPFPLQSTTFSRGSSAGTMFSKQVLRAANPHQFRPPPSSARSYSTSILDRLSPRPFSHQKHTITPIQRRTIFGVGAPNQSMLINMEQTANHNPNSASAQNAFYQALMRANMPKIVVERFQTGRYASNKACEDTYQSAVERVAKAEGGIQGALQGSRQFSDEQLRDIATTSAARGMGHLGQGRFANVMGGTGDKASPVHVLVDEPKKTTFFKWIKFTVGYGLLAYFVLVVMTLLVETSGILRRNTAQHAEAQAQQQTVRFSDVHGCDEAKEELQELVEFLKNPEKFSALGGKLPKGVLLVGPPGTGKTLLARAVAGEAGVPFFYMSGSEFDEIYVGVGAKRVRELFGNARAKAPAIIFIDELDAIGAKRNERDPTYVKQSLNQLLTELDGFSQDTGVIILGATNFPQLLDKALTRPGRFDRNVEVPLPDVRGRIKIIQHYLKSIKVDSDIEPELIARGTPGFSGAQLESLVNQAAVRASKNRTDTVTMLDMEWAKDKIMMGPERRSVVIQDKDKLMTAYHEAGHALVGIYTEGTDAVYKATIMPRGGTLGATHTLPDMDKVSITRQELRARLDVCMGGKAAEEIVYGEDKSTSGVSSDLSQATEVAHNMVASYGMSESLGNISLSAYPSLSTETRRTIESEVRSMIDAAHVRARALLLSKRKELDLLANALVEYEVLSLDEMKRVLKGEKLGKMKMLKGAPIKLPELILPPGIGGATGGIGGGSAGGPKGIKTGGPGGIHGGGSGAGLGGETTPTPGSEEGTASPPPPSPPPPPSEREEDDGVESVDAR